MLVPQHWELEVQWPPLRMHSAPSGWHTPPLHWLIPQQSELVEQWLPGFEHR
jgi:hypothetical protein